MKNLILAITFLLCLCSCSNDDDSTNQTSNFETLIVGEWQLIESYDNEELISLESRKLLSNDYSGDVIDKMYKSARYYFRHKSTAKVEPVKRRKYTACSRDFIDHMDNFISTNYKENNNFKPSDRYEYYVTQNKELFNKEKDRIKNEDKLEESIVLDKIKKLFKNRYFQLIKNK